MGKILPLITALLLFFSCGHPQKGKTQPISGKANSIVVAAESYIPDLSPKLHEISGLMIWNDLYWGFNDSGGENVLFGFDKHGEVKMEVELKKEKNHDWESITQNETHIFVGDFGNNHGTRRDLCVYKIKKSDIDLNDKNQKVETKKISFSYSSQNDFTSALNKNAYDCEAFVERTGTLHLFSKDWKNRRTEHYKLPLKKGKYKLESVGSFDVNGLVTGADISPDGKTLALLVYEDWKVFIWLFTDFEGDDFFSGKNTLLKFPALDKAQTEGICFMNNETLLVSCEAQNDFAQQVFLVNLITAGDGTFQNK